MSQLTVYPDADPESTTVDGRAYVGAQDSVWATIRAAAGNAADVTDATIAVPSVSASATSSQWALLARGIFLFNISAIPSGSSIDSATFSVYVNSSTANISGLDINITTVTPASDTSIVNADFNIANYGTTKLSSDLAQASVSTSAYNDFALNASGITAINTALADDGIFGLGLRWAEDIDNSAPSWSSGANSNINVTMADNGSNKPKLVVNYTPYPSGFFLISQ